MTNAHALLGRARAAKVDTLPRGANAAPTGGALALALGSAVSNACTLPGGVVTTTIHTLPGGAALTKVHALPGSVGVARGALATKSASR